MARFQTTPRFPLGTRVSKYFPGYKDPFGGTVDHHATDTGYYHITYDDGDSEEMTEEDLQVHAVKLKLASPASVPEPAPAKPKKTLILNLNDNAPARTAGNQPSAASSSTASNRSSSAKPFHSQPPKQQQQVSPRSRTPVSSDGLAVPPPGEENALIGRAVSKRVVDERGRESFLKGTVTAYFLVTRKYRVMFVDGRCEDLSYQDVVESTPLSSPSDEESKKRKLVDGAAAAPPSASPKKLKAMESGIGGSGPEAAPRSKSDEGKENLADLSPPFNTSGGLTSVFASNVSRSVLFVVVSASSDATDDKKRQLAILSNKALEPEKALEMFVEERGLATLNGLLGKWTQSTDTESGVLVILKILMVLPGIEAKFISESKIGKSLSKISKGAESWGFAPSVSDLARWTIAKWKKQFIHQSADSAARKTETPASSVSHNSSSNNGSNSSSSSNNNNGKKPKRAEKQPAEGKPKSSQTKNGAHAPTQTKRSNLSHLRELLGSKNGKSRDVLGSALGSGPKKLGPAYAHRARRSTVVLDAVERRVNEGHTDSNNPERVASAADDDYSDRVTRVKFADASKITVILKFEKEIEVSRLFEWRPVGERQQAVRPPPLTTRRLKSILRVRLEPEQPAVVVAEPDDALMAPPVVQTTSASASASSSRHLNLGDPSPSRVDGGSSSRVSSWKSSPPLEDDVEAESGMFSQRRERTDRSPPPGIDLTRDGDNDEKSGLRPTLREEAPKTDATDEKEEGEVEMDGEVNERSMDEQQRQQQQVESLSSTIKSAPVQVSAELDPPIPFPAELRQKNIIESMPITAE